MNSFTKFQHDPAAELRMREARYWLQRAADYELDRDFEMADMCGQIAATCTAAAVIEQAAA